MEDETFERYDPAAISERENFFHKPQVNLNWYFQPTNRFLLSTVAYYSGGRGGGTGTLGSLRRSPFVAGELWFNSSPWSWDWDATIERNRTNADSLGNNLGSTGILRNSRNNQWTIGAISKATVNLTDPLKIEFGVDWRTAEIEHYREVRDLLGGSFFRCNSDNRCGSSDFWSDSEFDVGLGDKIDYNFTNTVDWFGTFFQGEYVEGPFSVYGMGGLSTIKYTYTNFFVQDDSGDELFAETDNIWG